MKYSNLNLGTIEAIINKLGGIDGARRFLRGDVVLTEKKRSWQEKEGVIYLDVTSNGMSGLQWMEHFEKNGFDFSASEKRIFNSEKFSVSNGMSYEVAVIKDDLWRQELSLNKDIRMEAHRRGFLKPSIEVACLIRESFSDSNLKEMGLTKILVMHDSIFDGGCNPQVFSVSRYGVVGLESHAVPTSFEYVGSGECGYAYLVSH